MNQVKRRVQDFLIQYQMDAGRLDMEEYSQGFRAQMRRGLEGGPSSLSMLPTYLEVGREVPRNRKVIVLDAGGTNFRVATVYFDAAQNPVIENFKKFPMPGVGREVDKEEFFGTLAGYMTEVAGLCDRIGFCFSYPVEMFPNKDGRLIHFTKEVKAKTVEGEFIGAGLNRALETAGYPAKRIVVLNDTVATLLAGVSESKGAVYGDYIGFILGTGTNVAYVEKNSNIKKATGLDSKKRMIINVESGGFDGIPQGRIDREFDATTIDPGKYILEKTVSGRYLGDICHQVIRTAVAASLFSPGAAAELSQMKSLTTVDLNQFLHQPFNDAELPASALKQGNEDDRMALYYLIDGIIERAAKSAAICMAAAVLQAGTGGDPTRPICFTAEGTTFYQLKSFKSKIEYYLKQYLNDQKDSYLELVNIANATLIGAAVAGLTN